MKNVVTRLIKENIESKSHHLDLGNCGLTTLPSELFSLKWLTELNLGSHFLAENNTYIASSNSVGGNRILNSSLARLTELPQLKSLSLASNRLGDFSFLVELPKLESIDLSYNKIRSYAFLWPLTNLRRLSISLCSEKLKSDEVWLNLRNVNSLHITKWNRDGEEELDFIRHLSRLQHLKIGDQLVSGYSFLSSLTSLTSLDIGPHSSISYEYLRHLTKLSHLDLSRNSNFNPIIDHTAISQLSELKTLKAKNIFDGKFLNGLHNLSSLSLSNQCNDADFLGDVRRLESLTIQNCSSLDTEPLKKFENLTNLELVNCNLNEINFLKQGHKLRSLNLASNNISNINFLSSLANLRHLCLTNNNFSNIKAIANLRQLETIDLSNNRVNNIQPISNLNNAKSIFLGANKILDIKPLSQLNNAEIIDLSDNKVIDISVVDRLRHLRILNLRNNQVQYFSFDTLKSLPRLTQLFLTGNPVSNIPKDLLDINLGGNSLYILGDYFSSLEKGKLINDEVKLILVGNSTSGKTSLTKYLMDGKFSDIENSTHGISLNRWVIEEARTNLKVNIWDFGGQEYYHATHRLFMDDHAVYILVWEEDRNTLGATETRIFITGQMRSLLLDHFPYRYWLENIRYYAPKSPILMVQSKLDLSLRKELESYCFLPPYNVESPSHHLTVKNLSNGDLNQSELASLSFQIFASHLREVLRSSAAKYPLGKKWVEIRDSIRELPKTMTWMSIKAFHEFCKSIDPTIELDGLISYLRGSASTILYYPEDSLLSDMIFLNPQWVTDIIYSILSYDIQEKMSGEFTLDHVRSVLDKLEISNMADTFVRLMKARRFELIFEKPGQPNTFIAPQYLPDTLGNNKILEKLRPKDPLRFQLVFPKFMPKSLFIRFMVRYGNLSKDVYWKYGCILDKDDTRMFVECHFEERRISVEIGQTRNMKIIASELFDTFFELSDGHDDTLASVNGFDFVSILELQDANNDNRRIKSLRGNWVLISEFDFLFKKGDMYSTVEKAIDELNRPKENMNDSIFFSYAWADESWAEGDGLVTRLYKSLEKDGYKVVRDIHSIGYKDLLSQFMKRISKGKLVVVILSDKYFTSPYCMYELTELFNECRRDKIEFLSKIFPIKIGHIKLTDPAVHEIYLQHWENVVKQWSQLFDKRLEVSGHDQYVEYERARYIYREIGNLLSVLSDVNLLDCKTLSNENFRIVKDALTEQIKSISPK